MKADEIIDFWFSPETRPYWWAQSDDFDALVRRRFGAAHAAAAAGELDHLAEDAKGALALVILLDQLSRNLYRQDARAWACDAKALGVSRGAVARGLDQELDPEHRKLLYMPFMHSEDPAAHEEGTALFKALGDPQLLFYARLHQALVERFGRFPHRDPWLGRVTTAEEWELIEHHNLSFGVKRPESAGGAD